MSRIVIVEKEKCNPQGCGGWLCARVSPSNRAGKEAFYKDVDGKIGVNESLVSDIDRIACNKCPFGALHMIKLPEQLKEAPVHRYGKNGFVLYRLPIPIFGKVVGILGRNGVGKSTAVRILAGQLAPNLGVADKIAESTEKLSSAPTIDYAGLISHFKGNEAQGYFEKLRDERISLSYKPQQVEHIPKAFKGTVQELLGQVQKRDRQDLVHKEKSDTGLESGDTANYERVLGLLELKHLLDRPLDVLSGGELQRVAIAATALRGANVNFFDEPTSYLDIKQRLQMARFLQQLADEKTAVMLVDHDLIILDYMSELVHILYGQENGYGIVSQPKATKTGINVYLEGFLKEENMRFRDHKILFTKHAAAIQHKHSEVLAQWPAIEKRLGSFSLTANAGTIHRHDIIGILGENGIGKTTFVKELARVEAETSRGSLRVSYKPQYLEEMEGFDSEAIVEPFIENAKKYETQLMRPLDLAPLFEKKLSELSGGQLQRVVIARALAADADLFLLDEPSAYLDVEQRLHMSKIIREMMEAKGKACLVVDHDLLFIDYLSEKLIVFEGEPGKHGKALGPYSMAEGMNRFLAGLGITFRRDEENNRPRANKEESVKDREQKASGKLYYVS
jgi:ATP-binding cassette, sub-family E, member 1